MRPLRLAPLVTLAVLAVGPILTPGSAVAASCKTKAKASFVGLGGGDSLQQPAMASCILAQQAKAGAGVLRQSLDWRYIEPAPGVYDFSSYDAWVAEAARHRMRILPILSNPPDFRAHNTAKAIGRPRSNAAFGRYAAAVVARYGRNGSFWAQNPSVPKRPITSFQIWNEPNLPQYWGGKPSSKQYTALLKAAYKAIRKADPKADVVTAGLPESLIKHAIQASKFVPGMLKVHAAKYFTTLAVNPYARTGKGVIKSVSSFRKLLNRRHDRGDKLWVTEVGWGTGGPKNRFNIGAKAQAKQLKGLLRGLYKARRKLKLRGVVYYGWQDRAPYPPKFKDQWGLHTGLRTIEGKPKPAFKVFAKLAPKLR